MIHGENTSFAVYPRAAVNVVLVLGTCRKPATYRGIGYALGMGYSAVRNAVNSAVACGLVEVRHLRHGPRALAVVAITEKAAKILKAIGAMNVQR